MTHSHVVRLFEVLDSPEDDILFMVFECCDGGPIMNVSLDKTAKPYSFSEARKIFHQIVLGIEYLHEHDICHRGI